VINIKTETCRIGKKENGLIAELVKVFREALILELTEADFIETELSDFPYGSCEATSQMLALYLESEGIKDVVYTRNQFESSIHYWVVVNDLIIDLTAHQFSEVDEDFIVASESPFHSKFELLETHSPRRDSLNRMGSLYGYTRCYDSILSRVKNI